MTPTSHDHVKLGDHDFHQLQLLNEKTQASSSTISTHVLSYPNGQDQGSSYPREDHQLKYQQEGTNFASKGGSSNDHGLKSCLWKNESGQENEISRHRYKNIPTKWLPSKLRLVRKMMDSEQVANEMPESVSIKFEEYHKQGSSSRMETTENSSNNSISSTPIRVCSDCNTTKTPLWRSGPRGPKSLCNACGIRRRKARRALAEAEAAASGTTLATKGTTPSKPKVQQKDKRLKLKIAPCKKKSKLGNNNDGGKDKLCFEDFLISLSKNLALHQVFPQDEKEAAILLMALSCDLVHG